MTPKWTIMIATLGRRRHKLERMLGGLLPQVDAAGGLVTVEALWNNGERPIGQVRQDMLDHAAAEYVSFLDDDDEVPPYFVARVLPLLDGIDYIGWRQKLWRGVVEQRPVVHSLRYSRWCDMPRCYERDITHFNPMRRDLAVQGTFLGPFEAWSEDHYWASQLRGKVLTEHFIDEVMLFQRWDPADNTGPARRPADDPARFTRLEVDSPHFSWLPVRAPAISVLCPSRGRADSLVASADSLLSLAARPGEVEILIAADPDDPATAAAAERAGPEARLWTAPERYGYARLHEYLNHLVTLARGGWLLNWNDDARMLTPGWDEVIAGQDPAVLWLQANHHPGASMFPAWPRAWAQALGHVSPVPHVDTYLQWLGEALGGLVKVPVEVLHDRADVTGNHDDATYREGRARIGPHGMVPGGIPDREAVARDAEVIRALGAVRA